MKTLKFFSFLLLSAFSIYIIYSVKDKINSGATVIVLFIPAISIVLLFGFFLASDKGLTVLKGILYTITGLYNLYFTIYTIFIFGLPNNSISYIFSLVLLTCSIFLTVCFIKEAKEDSRKEVKNQKPEDLMEQALNTVSYDAEYIENYNAAFPKKNPLIRTVTIIVFLVISTSILIAYLYFNKSDVKSLTGKVIGQLNYPSDTDVPPMKIFLRQKDSDKTYSLNTRTNQIIFEFDSVISGDYVAYAYELDTSGKIVGNGAGYTNAVPCGLDFSCKDHSLLSFRVQSGFNSDTIRIFDWYGAILPPEIEKDKKSSRNISNFFSPKMPDNTVELSAKVENMVMNSFLLYTTEDSFLVVYTDVYVNNIQSAITIEKYMIQNNEVDLYETTHTDILHNTNDSTRYIKPPTILKIPSNSDKIKWEFSYENGQEEHCEAEMTTLSLNGQKCNSIKVTKSTFVNGKCLDSEAGKKIEFYAEDFGYAKSQIYDVNGNKIIAFNNFMNRYISKYKTR